MSAPSSPSLVDSAAHIGQATEQVNAFLVANGQPQPSFDRDAPPVFPEAPADIQAARQQILDACQTIYDALVGPAEYLRWLACRHHDTSSLQWLYHFNIAAPIPLDRAVPYSEVAATAKVDENRLKSVLRLAMTNRLFCEPHPDFVAHNAASALLVTSPALNDWVGYTAEETYPASVKLVEATERYGSSQLTNHAEYNLAFDTDEPMFVHLQRFPERERRLANIMVEMTSTEGYGVHHPVEGYPWEEVKGKVVDVSHASIAISRKSPAAQLVLQDAQGVVEQGRAALAPALTERITFQTNDFFTAQLVSADVRFILHDHPDAEAVKILQNFLPAMKKGSRIILNVGVLPEPLTLGRSEERIARIMDMEMITTFNARESPLEDWKKPCGDAHPALKLRRIFKPTGSIMSIMEFVLEEYLS
ncbi:putative O-methyltransferase [Aspergillus flavus]|uniref:O-methyltransferase n=1 Tax=Aspergillus flavus (strain ATCC 200026 / FGSC A1120 / IAM 13836 / NRRL 3357 / JCM 12722 / SRRC 167) TaxID=332952 RepID=A0A7U2MZ14_ASPFN|nr:putative O-methyltransferase [Aspergillus flavus]RAQ57556.1 O-methyltransferase [Aspergillus flavus]